MKFCFAEHPVYVTNQILSTPPGEHFNLLGHSLADMVLLEKVRSQDDLYRKEREENILFENVTHITDLTFIS